jgi:hypothetical protein
MNYQSTLCAVCKRLCELASCVTDEHGRALHASCYHKRVASNVCAPSRYDETEDLLQQARELREVADELIKRSDRLIEAYKQLSGQARREDKDRFNNQ